MTERFLPRQRASRADLKALRRKVQKEIDGVPWLDRRAAGWSGSAAPSGRSRAMHQRRSGYALDEIHGYHLPREGLEELIEAMAALPGARALPPARPEAGPRRHHARRRGGDLHGTGAARRGAHRDLRPGAPRGDLLRALARSRRAAADPRRPAQERAQPGGHLPLRARPRRAASCRRRCWSTTSLARTSASTRASPPSASFCGPPGCSTTSGVMVDYNDHHKHGYYLVLNAGLPGFRHRELALVALLVRSHRKALPATAPLEGVLDLDDDERLTGSPPACGWPSSSSGAGPAGSGRCGWTRPTGRCGSPCARGRPGGRPLVGSPRGAGLRPRLRPPPGAGGGRLSAWPPLIGRPCAPHGP